MAEPCPAPDTVQNSGAGLLTLSGTLTKNGTTLTLNGGANGIAVTGAIVGGAANSDLTVTTGKSTLSANNTYFGATAVTTGGTLEVATGGQLSGTTAVNVNTGGILLLSSTASNVINSGTPVPVTMGTGGGTLKVADAVHGNLQTFASLTLTATSTLDFGVSSPATNLGNKFQFSGLGGTTVADLTANTFTLNIQKWSSLTDYSVVASDANTDPNQDRFLIGNSSLFGPGVIAGISFFDDTGAFVGNGMEVAFAGGGFEIVAVPEPASTALFGSLAVCALIGFRERRRFTGIRQMFGKKKNA